MSTETADMLARAAQVVRSRGWHQGFFYESSVPGESCAVCAIGAMNIAAGRQPHDWEHDDTRDAMAQLVKFLELTLDDEAYRPGENLVCAIGKWNDDESRSVEGVLAALEGAAAAERAKAAAT